MTGSDPAADRGRGPGRGRDAAATRPRPRRPAPDPAREAAFEVLRAVDERDAYANLTLPGILRERRLDARDAAFATELAYGTLRRRGSLDAVLAACVDRPLDALDPVVLDLARLGCYQLLHTRVPPHAAVSATVELARARAGEGRARFLNAVLRRVSERDADGWWAEVAPAEATDRAGHLATVTGHPRWIVTAYADALGGDWDAAAAALAADDVRPEVHLAARPGGISRADLLEECDRAGLAAIAGPWSPYAVRLAGGDPGRLASVRAGRAGVQDEGSQLVAVALAAAPLTGPDRTWLDACAGPGGKAALLAGAATGRGGHLLAVERQAHRARLVGRGLQAVAGDRAAVAVADATVGPWRPASFDRVLLDVPCSGLGALRRRPEARWRRGPADVAALGSLQRGLLRAALAAVRPGGVVAYATCSPHLAETRVVVADVLRAGGAQPVDARPLLPGMPDLGPGPAVQLWPHRHGTDAMFLALLRRTE